MLKNKGIRVSENTLTVNGVIMRIYVPKGEHVIRFVFQPFSVIFGAIISAVSFLLLIVLISWKRNIEKGSKSQEDKII